MRLKRLLLIIPALGAVVMTIVAIVATNNGSALSGCQFQTAPSGTNVAFCDTFDAPASTGNRSGQLNGSVWGVSRVTGNNNPGQNAANAWPSTQLDLCGQVLSGVTPPNDVRICNGQLREALDDGTSVAVLAMYPKQPFDFAGRTGTAVFDVTNDSNGTHQAWPEFWVTDQPVPAPFAHFGEWNSPRNGFGVRFGGSLQPGGAGVTCPNDGTHRVGVDSAIVVRNYVSDDSANGGALQVTSLGCVRAASGPNGAMNHVELRVSQNQIDVYMTDAGSSALKLVARVSNANLTLTRGLVWIEDVHYNGNKDGGTQRVHTFAWDNVGFDGPPTYRDLTFDVLDRVQARGDGTFNLGWLTSNTNPVTLTTLPMTAGNISAASAHYLLLNAVAYGSGSLSVTYSLNGKGSHTVPLRSSTFGTSNAMAIPVSPTELIAGANTMVLTASDTMVVANVDILLVAAASVTGSVGTTTSGSTATATVPTATSTPSGGATASATSTKTSPTNTPTAQAAFCTTAYFKNGVLTPGNPMPCP
jgi:hypothetical protein